MAMIRIQTEGKTYTADIEKGNFEKIPGKIRPLSRSDRLFVVTDANLLRRYGERLNRLLEKEGFRIRTCSINPGESSKALSSYERICSDFIEGGISRKDTILAFGGGVVGDLAGFAAATIHRGLPYIQLPTSLIAQTDSSIGGKTGINLSLGKNLIGAFHHPEAVIIDPDLLLSLPEREIQNGMGEVVKYALISDEQLLRMLETLDEKRLFEAMPELIFRCLSIKAEMVRQDEKDQGRRLLLNFGHTIGHAIEAQRDYGDYSHGEAVAIGMARITRASEAMGFTQRGTYDRIRRILKKYQLPFEIAGDEKKLLIERIGRDKKAEGDKIRLVLLKRAGEAFIRSVSLKEAEDFI